jgi:hypothetical protein
VGFQGRCGWPATREGSWMGAHVCAADPSDWFPSFLSLARVGAWGLADGVDTDRPGQVGAGLDVGWMGRAPSCALRLRRGASVSVCAACVWVWPARVASPRRRRARMDARCVSWRAWPGTVTGRRTGSSSCRTASGPSVARCEKAVGACLMQWPVGSAAPRGAHSRVCLRFSLPRPGLQEPNPPPPPGSPRT